MFPPLICYMFCKKRGKSTGMSYQSAVAALPASSRSLGVRLNTDFVRPGALTLSHSRKSEAGMRT